MIGGAGSCVAGGLALAISVGDGEVAGLVCGTVAGGVVFLIAELVPGRVLCGLGLGLAVVDVVGAGAGGGVSTGIWGCRGTDSGAGAVVVGAWACGGGKFGFFFLQPASNDNVTTASTRMALRSGMFSMRAIESSAHPTLVLVIVACRLMSLKERMRRYLGLYRNVDCSSCAGRVALSHATQRVAFLTPEYPQTYLARSF